MCKLNIELIPAKCAFSNVRTMVTTKEWDLIRKFAYTEANNVCKICYETGKAQGYRHNLECHETWAYDDKKKIQKLTGLVALCVRCHMAKHIGRASAIGKQAEIFEHMGWVNEWTHKEIVTHMAEAFELQKKRAKIIYTLDISILAQEPYSIVMNPEKARVFKKAKYKKKRRKR